MGAPLEYIFKLLFLNDFFNHFLAADWPLVMSGTHPHGEQAAANSEVSEK